MLAPDTNYEQFYAETLIPFVTGMLTGKNCVFFSYGVTKSGNSILMGKYEEVQLPEMLPLTVKLILKEIEGETSVRLKVSFYEVYRESIRDLLGDREPKSEPENAKKVKIRESKKGIKIENLTEVPFSSMGEFEEYFQIGKKQHLIEHTKMSTMASKSNEILTLRLENSEGEDLGSVSFVELATHEREKSKTAPYKE